MTSSESDVEVAIAAASTGAAVVRSMYGTPLERFDKSATDFATAADLAAEDAILAVLRADRPSDGIVGEEYGASGSADSPRQWLVDPLCGTLNFAARTPLFSVNVALPSAGVAAVADPIADEVFWCSPAGAFLGSVALQPSAVSRLVDVNVDLPAPALGSELLTDPAFRAAFGPRVLSTTLAVAWVAAGRRAAYVTAGDLRDSVHFAAGILLCQAAGCVVTDLQGGPVFDGPGLIAAADSATHARLLAIVTRLRR